MKDTNRKTEVSIGDLLQLRHRIAELEKANARYERIEEELQGSEERLLSVIRNNADGIIVVDTKGLVRFANPAVALILGRREDEVVGEAFGFPMVTRGTTELDIVRGRAEIVTVEMRVTEVEWEGESAYIASMRDTTERKHMEQALRESEEKYRDVVERANDGIAIIQDTVVKYANPQALEITGSTPEDIVDTPMTNYIHPDELPKVLDRYQRRMACGDVEPVYETALLRKDGSRVDVEMNAATVSYQGRPADLVIIRDITERRRVEEARQETDRLKSEFIANISHELRTPLQSIMGVIELLLKDMVPDRETQREFLTIADEQSGRLYHLIGDLIDVSRMESGRFRIEKVTTHIRDLVHSMVVDLGTRAGEKGVRFRVNLPEGLPEMEADPDRIRQVLANLLDNAIKFSSVGGEIVVQAEVENREMLVHIADCGIGIAAESIPSLFERFYQVDGSMTRANSGSGLGLYISKQIIDEHGGRIWVDSPPGRGSTFSFSLPLGKPGGPSTIVPAEVERKVDSMSNEHEVC